MSRKQTKVTYAFIDGQNLNLGVRNDVVNARGKVIYHGRKLDYRRFRHYLREKYGVSQAYIFIGLMPTNNSLYSYLQRCGFTLVFKTISSYMDEAGQTITKGNVDTDIVIWSIGRLYDEFDQAVYVSGDGDFLSLYEYMQENDKLAKVIVPNRFRYSKLLNTYRDKLAFVGDIPNVMQKADATKAKTNKKTRSSGRITSLGQPGHGDKPSLPKQRSIVKKGSAK